MWDDEPCSAEDIGGNLGGPCGCRRCAATLEYAVAQGIPVKESPLIATGRVSYDGVRSLPPRDLGCIVLAAPTDSALRERLIAATAIPLGVLVSGPHVSEPFTVPSIEVREAGLETAAREFGKVSPSFADFLRTPDKTIDHDARRTMTAKLRRAALQYAAEYLAAERELDGGDYHEAIAELRDPTIKEIK